MEDVTAKVARQYTDYIYPEPITDLNDSAPDYGDPSIYGPMLWPEGPPRPDLDILVAGCGAQQAALLAFRNPLARVVGVDLSEASLGHQRFLAQKHGLKNLELHHGDLREAGSLNRKFDLVVSTGVLHHMADPSEGLRALRDVLKPSGAMMLMVYGAVGRRGVYALQDAFRRLGLGQSALDISTVRQILDVLPAAHCVQPYLGRAAELVYDTAIVDTFLHPQDRAYTVPELLEWVDANGLEFQTWMQNQVYYPDALIPDPACALVRQRPPREQWAIVEALVDILGVHIFVARAAGQGLEIDFEKPGWPAYRPRLFPRAGLLTCDDGVRRLGLNDIRFDVTPAEEAAVLACTGELSIAEILDTPFFAAFPAAEREAFAKAAFARFWKIGVMMFEFGARSG